MLSSSCSSFFFPAVFSFSTRIRFIFRLRDWVFHYSRKSLWMNRESHSLSLSTTETEIQRRKRERREKERRRKDTEEGEGEKKRERLQWCEWICEEYTHAYEYRHVLISTILSLAKLPIELFNRSFTTLYRALVAVGPLPWNMNTCRHGEAGSATMRR